MRQISLKRLLAKKEVRHVIDEIISAINTPMGIQDLEGKLLLGSSVAAPEHRHPIRLDDRTIGWVLGDPKALSIAELLSYLANLNLEKKELAQETLERYKEINLLYNVSERMSATLELEEVATLVLEEARKLIDATSGSVMLLNEKENRLDILSAFGIKYNPATSLRLGEGIAGYVALTRQAEIVNDVLADCRYIPGKNQVRSLICAPLRTKDWSIGVINLSNEKSVQYTAADLKLLNALAAQAASAIENAILHKNKLKEERIKSNLERYVASQVVQAILDLKGDITLEPIKRNVAILFSDIRNFTTKCEELAPEEIVGYLNEYFTHMVDVIFHHKGTVNKFVGDMIVAFFGAPSKMDDAEERAIATAIDMQKRIESIPVPWIRENFLTGIGIASGTVVVGNIGSPRHMDYTAIGDEVNTASRLQSLAKGGQILVTRNVRDVTESQFEFKSSGKVKVKGKKQKVEIFEVLY